VNRAHFFLSLIEKNVLQRVITLREKTIRKCLTTISILAISVQTYSTSTRISYPIPRKLGKKMTKAELIDAVAQKAGVSKADAERTIGSFFELVVASAKNGEKVAWPGFGSFSTSSRKARTGRNPQTGAPVQVPASIAMKFTSSSTLKSELNPNRK
jgi:DNA-binding protein HU-beta